MEDDEEKKKKSGENNKGEEEYRRRATGRRDRAECINNYQTNIRVIMACGACTYLSKAALLPEMTKMA